MKLRNKLLYPILAAYFALIPVKSSTQSKLFSPLPQGYSKIQEETPYYTKYKNNKYAGILVGGGRNGSAWFIYNTNNKNIIGDEKTERADYGKLAKTFEIERFDSLNPEYPGVLRSLSRDMKIELAQYELTYRIPLFALEFGSRLEGILIGYIPSGGANLPAQVQVELIKSTFKSESETLKKNFLNELKINEKDLKFKNAEEIAEKLKVYYGKTLESKLLESTKKLERAADIFERNDNNWTYETASAAYQNWLHGQVVSIASARTMHKLENNSDFKFIAKKIISHFGEGFAGIPASEIAKYPELQRINEEFYLELERAYNVFNPLITHFDVSDPNSAASRFLDSEWPKQEKPQTSEPRQVVVNYLNALKNKNTKVLPNLMEKNLAPESIPDKQTLEMIASVYSCRDFNISKIEDNIFYVTEKNLKPNCHDIFTQRGIPYLGEIIYLRKTDSWKILEVKILTKDTIRSEARARLFNMSSGIISHFAEFDRWPTFAPEPSEIPSFIDSPAGVPCNVPFLWKDKLSDRRCYFSYRLKSTDPYIVEAIGNVDSDSDLEIWEIDIPSKTLRNISQD